MNDYQQVFMGIMLIVLGSRTLDGEERMGPWLFWSLVAMRVVLVVCGVALAWDGLGDL